MITTSDRQVVLELILALVRLLRHVDVSAKANPGRETEERAGGFGVNQVVPVLIARSERIDHSIVQLRRQRHVRELQLIPRKVPFGQVITLARLVVASNIKLIAVAEEDVIA